MLSIRPARQPFRFVRGFLLSHRRYHLNRVGCDMQGRDNGVEGIIDTLDDFSITALKISRYIGTAFSNKSVIGIRVN